MHFQMLTFESLSLHFEALILRFIAWNHCSGFSFFFFLTFKEGFLVCIYMLKNHTHIVTGNLLNLGQEKWGMVIGDVSRCVVSSVVQILFFLYLFKSQVH